jgi:hypothetical protein
MNITLGDVNVPGFNRLGDRLTGTRFNLYANCEADYEFATKILRERFPACTLYRTTAPPPITEASKRFLLVPIQDEQASTVAPPHFPESALPPFLSAADGRAWLEIRIRNGLLPLGVFAKKSREESLEIWYKARYAYLSGRKTEDLRTLHDERRKTVLEGELARALFTHRIKPGWESLKKHLQITDDEACMLERSPIGILNASYMATQEERVAVLDAKIKALLNTTVEDLLTQPPS